MSNYSLEVVSHHPEFNGKTLRKYHLEGIDSVGAYGDEEFSVVFKNNTYQTVQVKISIDGTCVATGKPATTEVDNDGMWLVHGHNRLELKAWREDDHGGAAFVFTNTKNSVAVHTHGDLSCRGIIAAAVYTEGHVKPIRYNNPIVIKNYDYRRQFPYDYIPGSDWTVGDTNVTICSSDTSVSTSVSSVGTSASNNILRSCNVNNVENQSTVKNLDSLVAVGAGQYTEQEVNYMAGLIKPTFTETVRVKFMWWDELVAKLKKHNVAVPHPSGFPGDKPRGVKLGKTPRIGKAKRTVAQKELEYSRI